MTQIAESFNKADSTVLGPDLTWTELNGNFSVVSNQAVGTLGADEARADTDLGSTDHFAQGDLTGSLGGVMVRKDATATRTFYFARWSVASNTLELYKRVAGTATLLATANIKSVPPNTVKLVANGSRLHVYHNGALKISIVDASITTGLRCGIVGASANVAAVDVWSAGDLDSGVIPGAPVLAAAAVSHHATKAFLQMTPGTGAATHTLHRSTITGFVPGAGNKIADLGAVFEAAPGIYKDTGLTPSTTYFYKLRALNSAGTADSGEVSVVTRAVGHTYSDAILALSPAGYWRLGDAAGTGILVDSSGNGHNATAPDPDPANGQSIRGEPGLLIGDSDTALKQVSFGGSGPLPQVQQTGWHVFLQAVTVMHWIKITDVLSVRPLIGSGVASSLVYSIEAELNTGRIQFEQHDNVGGGEAWTANQTKVAVGETAFLCNTRASDGLSVKFYKNGAWSDSAAFTVLAGTHTDFFSFCHPRAAGTCIFDEAAVWGSELSPATIASLYEVGITGVVVAGGGPGVTVMERQDEYSGSRRVVSATLADVDDGDTWVTGLRKILTVEFMPTVATAWGATVSGGTVTFRVASGTLTGLARVVGE